MCVCVHTRMHARLHMCVREISTRRKENPRLGLLFKLWFGFRIWWQLLSQLGSCPRESESDLPGSLAELLLR